MALAGDDAAQTELFLKAGVALDHEPDDTLTVTVQVNAAPSISDALYIDVAAVNEPPVFISGENPA